MKNIYKNVGEVFKRLDIEDCPKNRNIVIKDGVVVAVKRNLEYPIDFSKDFRVDYPVPTYPSKKETAALSLTIKRGLSISLINMDYKAPWVTRVNLRENEIWLDEAEKLIKNTKTGRVYVGKFLEGSEHMTEEEKEELGSNGFSVSDDVGVKYKIDKFEEARVSSGIEHQKYTFSIYLRYSS